MENENTIQTIKPTETYIQKTISLIDNYIGNNDWRIKENSNSSYSIQGLYDHIVQFNNALYWLNNVYDKDIRDAHTKGDFHIHDLGYLSGYCMGWDLEQLLIKGFGGVPGKVCSKPPKHFSTALGQIWNFLYTMQGEYAGAQAFSSFDTYLAPFIRYDNLDYNKVKQLMEEFIYNMNVPTRSGTQVPFTNITLDLQCPSTLKNKHIIIGGEYKEEKYSDFQNEMNCINKAFCEVMSNGDATQKMFSFPIPTYNITDEFNWDDPNYEPIWEMTSKYGIPYFANFCGSDMSPDDARSMCCRLRLSLKDLRKRGGGLFGSNPMTGSIGVVTINLPRLGHLSKSKKELFERLDILMDLAAKSLIMKREVIEKNMDNDVYPYSKYYLSDIKERFGKYFFNHFNTIGIVGMNECCLNFLNKDILSNSGLELSKEILNHMRNRLIIYQEEYKTPFNLEATPAEGTSYRLAKHDVCKYKNIITSGTNENPYYTNSSNIPVKSLGDIFDDFKHQEQLQPLYTGGTVFHIYTGDYVEDYESVKILIKQLCKNFKIPYISFTPTFSICPEHGIIPGVHETCPYCVDVTD